MHAFTGQSKEPMPACAQDVLLGGVEQVWQAEEMVGMVGKLVTLSTLFKPVSKYTVLRIMTSSSLLQKL